MPGVCLSATLAGDVIACAALCFVLSTGGSGGPAGGINGRFLSCAGGLTWGSLSPPPIPTQAKQPLGEVRNQNKSHLGGPTFPNVFVSLILLSQ